MSLIPIQEALLAVTNSFEGNVFVNATTFTNASFTLPDYVTQLFPRLDASQIQDVVAAYSNVSDLPTILSQAEAVMGESEPSLSLDLHSHL